MATKVLKKVQKLAAVALDAAKKGRKAAKAAKKVTKAPRAGKKSPVSPALKAKIKKLERPGFKSEEEQRKIRQKKRAQEADRLQPPLDMFGQGAMRPSKRKKKRKSA